MWDDARLFEIYIDFVTGPMSELDQINRQENELLYFVYSWHKSITFFL